MKKNLAELRAVMEQHSVDAVIIPSNDEFMNEYVPDYARRLEWLTGFSGSAGMAIILKDKAALFTDGRYMLQAAQQLPKNEYEIINTADVKPTNWLKDNLKKNQVVAINPMLHSKDNISKYQTIAEVKLCNLVDEVWKDKPQKPASKIVSHPLEYSGKSHTDKINEILANIKGQGADMLLLSAPDSICWLLNIRGEDVPNTPLVLARLLLNIDGSGVLFVDASKPPLKGGGEFPLLLGEGWDEAEKLPLPLGEGWGEGRLIEYTEKLKEYARELRKNQTDVEKKLWFLLRNRRFFGYKFRRQVPFSKYIADFVCIEKKVIVELDGGQHATNQEYDQDRTYLLEKKGFKIIRFWNTEVNESIEGVLVTIFSALTGKEVSLTLALSQGERELPHNIKTAPLASIPEYLSKISNKTILLDKSSTPYLFFDLLQKNNKLIESSDPCTLPKAYKNSVEITGAIDAHVRDAVAVTSFLYWLEKNYKNQDVTEVSLSEKLLEFRKKDQLFKEPSFDTIAGFASNGAIVHYHASNETSKKIEGNSLLLLDSGGQYLSGTTDITRTIAIGTPTIEQKRNFTLVLKGHIAIATCVFPEGTSGHQIDILARQYLWQNGLDYDHGTGHGVGSFLGVHEGPQRISKAPNEVALKPGMIVSNEPGYYKQGEYGIRIESLVVVEDAQILPLPLGGGWGEGGAIVTSGNKKFFRFKTLTCVPIDMKLVDESLLNNAEKQWLRDYHADIQKKLKPLLDVDVYEWIKN